MDFVSDQFFNGKRFRILTIIDTFTRECLSTYTAVSIQGGNVVEVLEKLKHLRGKPEYIRVDNGRRVYIKIT